MIIIIIIVVILITMIIVLIVASMCCTCHASLQYKSSERLTHNPIPGPADCFRFMTSKYHLLCYSILGILRCPLLGASSLL